MSSAKLTPTSAPPDDPVRRAAADPKVRAELTVHAAARILVQLADRRAGAPAELVEDAVQEALQRAIARASQYSPERGTPAGWLHGFLNRVLLEQCRIARKQPAQPAADLAAWDVLAPWFDSGASEAARQELGALLVELVPENREIITLHHLHEMSHSDIAARLEISPAASRTRLARAMIALRELAARKEGGR
jgi:RNA polymerase sigma-70 factor (ECF subfamily)